MEWPSGFPVKWLSTSSWVSRLTLKTPNKVLAIQVYLIPSIYSREKERERLCFDLLRRCEPLILTLFSLLLSQLFRAVRPVYNPYIVDDDAPGKEFPFLVQNHKTGLCESSIACVTLIARRDRSSAPYPNRLFSKLLVEVARAFVSPDWRYCKGCDSTCPLS